nr:MAG TPA: hypothetical protein [Caudoviricetes sp.]
MNCWKPLKLSTPQHSVEMRKCDGDESRKKWIDGAWLNPKRYLQNGQSAAKLRIGERSTTKWCASDWRILWWAPHVGEDIVCASLKE